MARCLLAYYDARGRDLPWRGGQDLYRIWVAEIMLQQTGVKTVMPYYQTFLERFPDVVTLAYAPLETVLACWQGLGYYRRAVHLHAAACRVVFELNGRFPETMQELLTLPGIGLSTAGAILAIGLNQHHPILDGNVKRVLARLLALELPVDSTKGRKILWHYATELTSVKRPGDYAQAIMDLGAEVCRLRHPDCLTCPWNRWCQAWLQSVPMAYPVKAPKVGKPHKYQFNLLVYRPEGQVLMVPRPAKGLLGGLWEPLSGEMTLEPLMPTSEQVEQRIYRQYGVGVSMPRVLTAVEHVFTHFRLTVVPFVSAWIAGEPNGAFRWVDAQPDQDLPISTLHHKVLARGREAGGVCQHP